MAKNTYKAAILNHLNKVGSISIREAMDDYGMSGGSLTKYMTILRREGHSIHRESRKHPISGRRYARYHLVSVYKPEVKEVVYKEGDKVILTDNFPGLDWGKGMTFFVNKNEGSHGESYTSYSMTNGYWANSSIMKPDTSHCYSNAA